MHAPQKSVINLMGVELVSSELLLHCRDTNKGAYVSLTFHIFKQATCQQCINFDTCYPPATFISAGQILEVMIRNL